MIDLNTFYIENSERQTHLMSKLAGSIESGEDVVQEAYTRAWKYQGSYNPRKAELKTWFNTILYNTLRDFRKEDKLGGVVMESKHDEIAEVVPYEKIQEHLFLLWGEINNLTNERSRRVLYLFYILGYTSKEISEIEEGVSQSNVTTISNRFKQTVKQKHGVEV